MAPGRTRDEQNEQQWQRRINQWRSSGMSVRAFCARNRLSDSAISCLTGGRRRQRRNATRPVSATEG
jgi:hypothetical protein